MESINTAASYKPRRASRLLALLLALVLMPIGQLVGVSTVFAASASDVCVIGSVGFSTLKEALEVAQDGQTIRLLTNIEYFESLVIDGKSLTFDVGSYELYVSTVWQNAIQVNDGNLWLDDSGGGELNAHCSGPYSYAVSVTGASSSATVTSANAHYSAVVVSMGSVTVKGDATATSLDADSSGTAIDARHGARVLIMGNVAATSLGVSANGVGTSVHVMGDAYGFGKPTQIVGTGAYAGSGSTVVVDGDAIGEVYGAYTMNGTITVGGNAEGGNPYLGVQGTGILAERAGVALVYGNVKGTWQGAKASSSRISIVGNVLVENQRSDSSELAVYALDGGNITVAGNVASNYIGVCADNWGSFVQIRGSVTADYCAAYARQSATIQIDGSILSCRYIGIDVGGGCLVTVSGDVRVTLSTEAVPVTYGVFGQYGTVEIGGNLTAGIGVFADYGSKINVTGDITANLVGVHVDNSSQATIDGAIIVSLTAQYITNGTVDLYQGQHVAASSKLGYLEFDLGDSFVWVRGLSVGAPGSGDFNGDGFTTLDEALIAARIVVGSQVTFTAEQFAAIDMDGDGYITMTDVLLIMRRALGM